MAGIPLIRERTIQAVAAVHPTLGVVMPTAMCVMMIGVVLA
jgi:hypothetical protein